jgi:hypothetical protein
MTELFIQDAIVTIVAFAAACVVAWRVFSVVQPSQAPSCANCPSAAAHGRKPQRAPNSLPQPIALIRQR